jgi:predicted nucleotidyltransferase
MVKLKRRRIWVIFAAEDNFYFAFLQNMRNTIEEQLQTVEKKHGVKILYACESGSRAWGFASIDSDYDVRFIYAQPADRYLSIQDRRNVIELPVDHLLDINGWDIKKALQLFHKSNGPLYEWLQSPIVYKEEGKFAGELRDIMPAYFSGRAGCHHYLSMARNTFENELQGVRVKLKKYFYALRPALACQWIIERQAVPPMEFSVLRTLVKDGDWQSAVDDILILKQGAEEKAMIDSRPVLQNWLQYALDHYKKLADEIPPLKNNTEELDKLFRKHIAS